MTDIVKRLREIAYEAADEIERLRADLLKAEMRAEIAGLENIMRAVARGRREGIEAAAKVCDERGNAEMQTLSDGKEYYRPHADKREAKRCAAAIRALLEDE